MHQYPVTQRGEDQWDLVLRLVTTAPPTEADQEKSRLVRGSLRIHPHQKTGTVRILERWQSGDGKLLASVMLGPITRPRLYNIAHPSLARAN
jgi:hypothetical protein